MATLDFEDQLEPFGVLAGGLLVLFGLGTLAGFPWQTKPIAPFLVQLVGVLAMIAIGAALVWISRSD